MSLYIKPSDLQKKKKKRENVGSVRILKCSS